MGAGLHVAAYALEGEAKIGETGTVLSVVIPVAVFALALYALYSVLFHTADRFHLWLLAGTALLLVAAVLLAAAGAGVTVSLLVVALAPVVTVVGFETSATGTWRRRSAACRACARPGDRWRIHACRPAAPPWSCSPRSRAAQARPR